MGPLFSLLAIQWFVHGSHFPLHHPRWVFFQAMKKICTHRSEQLNNRNHKIKAKKKKKKCYRCHIVCSLDILIKTCNSIGALSNFNLTERKEKKLAQGNMTERYTIDSIYKPNYLVIFPPPKKKIFPQGFTIAVFTPENRFVSHIKNWKTLARFVFWIMNQNC